MKKRTEKRWRKFADARIQGPLCLRVIAYMLLGQLTMAGTILALASLGVPASEATLVDKHFIIPAIAVSSLTIPIFLFDMLYFSNRFAGPMVNFRRKVKQIVNNEPCEPIKFREGDYYMDLCDPINDIRSRLVDSTPSDEVPSDLKTFPPVSTSIPNGIEEHA